MQNFSSLAFKGEAVGVAQISVNGEFFPTATATATAAAAAARDRRNFFSCSKHVFKV
jgi:hypothetical protein